MHDDRDRELEDAERRARDEAGAYDFLEPEGSQRPRRRRRVVGPLVVLAVAILVLSVAAAAGWGLALFVARVASVEPPAVTISPQPTATASPSPRPSSPSPSAASPSASLQATASAIPSQAIHVVQPGEYLSQIAARYGVTVEAIVEANGIENPNLIEPGQRLIIPPKP